MARPVVASTGAFEGIEAGPGRDLIVADGAEAQADAVLALLADPDAGRRASAAAARRRMAKAIAGRPGSRRSRRWSVSARRSRRHDRARPPRRDGRRAVAPGARHLAALGAGLRPRSCALFARDAADMAAIWWNSSTFNHCLLILPIIAWLVCAAPARAARSSTPAAWWPGPAARRRRRAGLAARRGGRHRLRPPSRPACSCSRARSIACLGKAVARGLAFPLFYALFLVPVGEELVPAMQTLTAQMTAAPARPHRRARPSRGHLHHHADRLFRGRRGLRGGQVPDRHGRVRRARRQRLLPLLAAAHRLHGRRYRHPDPRQRHPRLGNDLRRAAKRQHRIRRELRPCRLWRHLLRHRHRPDPRRSAGASSTARVNDPWFDAEALQPESPGAARA